METLKENLEKQGYVVRLSFWQSLKEAFGKIWFVRAIKFIWKEK